MWCVRRQKKTITSTNTNKKKIKKLNQTFKPSRTAPKKKFRGQMIVHELNQFGSIKRVSSNLLFLKIVLVFNLV